MTIPTMAEWYVAVLLLVTGVSHVLHPRAWCALFRALIATGHAGLVVGTTTLMLGLLILLAHPRWSWSPGVLVTVVGWCWTIKGTLYMLWPGLIARVANRHLERPARMATAGAVMVVFVVAAVAASRLGAGAS